jgi:hypothetical protein
MASYDDGFYNDEDAYRQRIMDDLNPSGGIVGPEYPSPTATAPTKTYDRDKLVTGWRDSPYGADETGLKSYLAESPYSAGVQYSGGDKITGADGRIFDLIGNVGTSAAQKRTGYTTDKRYASVTGSSKGRTGGGGAPQASAFQQSIRDLIMSQLGQLQKPVDPNDPAIASQQNAYDAQRQRGAQRTREAMAERAAQQGMLQGGQSSGAFDTTVQGINEQAGQDSANNLAGLMGAKDQQRVAQLTSLLNMAMQSGDAEMARALQMELAQIDASLRRDSLAQQSSQFNDTYGRTLGRDYEDDYRFRVLYGLGA